jgi:hypothetical protein
MRIHVGQKKSSPTCDKTSVDRGIYEKSGGPNNAPTSKKFIGVFNVPCYI